MNTAIKKCIDRLRAHITDTRVFISRPEVASMRAVLEKQTEPLAKDIELLIEKAEAVYRSFAVSDEFLASAGLDDPEEQKVVREALHNQAVAAVGSLKTAEQASKAAVDWCFNSMCEAMSRDYWKERAEAAERLLGLKVEPTRDGSVHIQAPPEGLVLEGVTIKGRDAT